MEKVKDEELSPQELAKRKEQISKFYKDNIKHLKVQFEYEELLTKIEKTRAERLQAQIFMAQAYAAQNPDEEMKQAKAEFDKLKKEP